MNRTRWMAVVSASMLLAGTEGVQARIVFNEDFEGNLRGQMWDFYRTGNYWEAAEVTNGVLRTSMNQNVTAVAGLVLDQPIAVGSDGVLEVSVAYTPKSVEGNFFLSFGLVTGDPHSETGDNQQGWAWFESYATAAGAVNSAASKIKLHPAGGTVTQSWDQSHGLISQWSNNSRCYLRLRIDTVGHTFSTFVSADGVTWAQKGHHALTDIEQANLETDAYYLLMRLVSFSNTATVEVDRVWAEAEIEVPPTVVYEEDFDTNALGAAWDYYHTAGQWSAATATNGMFRISYTNTATAVAGLALNTPIPVGWGGLLNVYARYKPLSVRNSFLLSFGMLTDDPGSADGATATGWGYFISSQNAAGSVNNASSRIRIKRPGQSQVATWDVLHGLVSELRNGAYGHVRLSIDTRLNTFATAISSDGRSWTVKGTRALTEDEQTYLEADDYYLLFRLIAYGPAVFEIDRVWAEHLPQLGSQIVIR